MAFEQDVIVFVLWVGGGGRAMAENGDEKHIKLWSTACGVSEGCEIFKIYMTSYLNDTINFVILSWLAV